MTHHDCRRQLEAGVLRGTTKNMMLTTLIALKIPQFVVRPYYASNVIASRISGAVPHGTVQTQALG